MRDARMRKAMWNETETVYQPRCKTVEEQIERRRTAKRLIDCELPEGFRLVTPRPIQYWMGGQLVWGFSLAWARVRNGVRGEDEFTHVARYFPSINDDVQMRWALDDFTLDLVDQETTNYLPMKPLQPVNVWRMAS